MFMDIIIILGTMGLCAVVVMASDKEADSVIALARLLLRVLSAILFMSGIAIAFGYVDVPTKYYGYVKVAHNLGYATVLEIAALVLVGLSKK